LNPRNKSRPTPDSFPVEEIDREESKKWRNVSNKQHFYCTEWQKI